MKNSYELIPSFVRCDLLYNLRVYYHVDNYFYFFLIFGVFYVLLPVEKPPLSRVLLPGILKTVEE